MELLINKRLFVENGGAVTSVVEPVARIPYATGVHQTPVGEVALRIGEFNSKKGTEKVIIFSEELHAKGSRSDRRVVEFSRRHERVVAHDINATARYEFSRKG